MNKKIPTGLAFLIIAIATIFLVAIVGYFSNGIRVEDNSRINIPNKKNELNLKITNKNKTMCTQEVKVCPDGLYVSRTGPNCEFTPCPNEKNASIANPASVFCEQNGGKLEIITAEDGGQSGMCKFSDGSQCEEWAFMRGECKIGDSQKKTDL